MHTVWERHEANGRSEERGQLLITILRLTCDLVSSDQKCSVYRTYGEDGSKLSHFGRPNIPWNSENGAKNLDFEEGSQHHIDSRSPMLDTIDKLTKPTKCSLLDGSGNKVELALATVFPLQKTLHTVPVQDGYAVLQPSYVWGNTGHYPLPVPIGGDEVKTPA